MKSSFRCRKECLRFDSQLESSYKGLLSRYFSDGGLRPKAKVWYATLVNDYFLVSSSTLVTGARQVQGGCLLPNKVEAQTDRTLTLDLKFRAQLNDKRA